MKLNVIYCSDENYVKHAGISILSLLENNKCFDEIDIYLLENQITELSKQKIKSIVEKYNRNIIFISCEHIIDKFNKQDDFPLAGYARLFISEIINEDKILYLDCDTIINNSLKDLWDINIESYLVAGVQDNPAKYMIDIIGMNHNDRYINSGVLLINLKRWREENVEKNFIKFIEKYRGQVPHHDQGVINGVCKGEILIIKPKYNMMPQMLLMSVSEISKLYQIKNYYEQDEVDEATQEPVIIHYITKFYNRPWCIKCTHPFKDSYLTYLNISAWDNQLSKNDLDIGIKIRKYIYKYMPFSIYSTFEWILDLKRKRYLDKKYYYISN